MAFLFRPQADKPIPDDAVRVRIKGRAHARWTKRGGGTVTAPILKSGRCRITSPVWWVEYRDHRGKRCRESVSRDRKAAEHRMAQIVQDVERQKGGLPARSETPTGETLTALAARYEQHLLDLGRTPKHATGARRRIGVVLKDCGWATVADVTADRFVRWIGEARRGPEGAPGFAAETINHHIRSMRGFLRWAFKADPLASVKLLNVEADRRIVRRALPATDFRKFIDTTRASKKVRLGLDGPSRAALYLIAARTGLRAGVLAGLKRSDLKLDADVPHIPTEARTQKNRKSLLVPIPTVVVEELKGWVESRPADGLLWPGNWHGHNSAAKIVHKDLTAAGIPITTADGSCDFHSFRGMYITELALAGVPVQVAQQLVGHSTPLLTAKFYTKLTLGNLADAANRIGKKGSEAAGAGIGREICSKDPKQPSIPANPVGSGTGANGTTRAGKTRKTRQS